MNFYPKCEFGNQQQQASPLSFTSSSLQLIRLISLIITIISIVTGEKLLKRRLNIHNNNQNIHNN